jgi:formylglycine-generating enzyme required for sulfatase activity
MTYAPVGFSRPNAFGLHDVHGNLLEWCQDAYARYDSTPADGSAFEEDDARYRIFRGGCWILFAMDGRSASRDAQDPDFRSHVVGLRPACSLN